MYICMYICMCVCMYIQLSKQKSISFEMIKVPSEQQPSSTNEGSKGLVGVPLLLVDGNKSQEEVFCAICDHDVTKLPSPDEVGSLGG